MIRIRKDILYIIGIWLLFPCCRPSTDTHTGPALFETLGPDRTGLTFSNSLHPSNLFNVFDYMYYYNGGGVAAGDFNNDGLIDLFFTANQGHNKLFLNQKDLKFKDVSDSALIPRDSGWSTGVSVIDINNDGLLDIYICKVGDLEGLPHARNQLLICQGIDRNGIPRYHDMAKEYGLDFSGFSTQAAFVDYDGDGDLDMYLMNHSIHQNGTFGPRKEKLAITSPVSGDRLFRNDGNNHFTEVTKEAGINSSVLGYGLGLIISDIDMDGYPDIYVGNDFHENDYMYINQRNGTFKEQLNDHLMHTSQFCMGVDIADANNDGFPEIITMDMLPFDPYILKRSEGEDSWDIFNMKIGFGYNYQYTRNNLQLNRRNGQFSEIGLYSGVAATDWSWSPLWMDFDNDGLKDLFISNGIPKRLNDIDYINFVSNDELQQKMQDKTLDSKDLDLTNKFPQIKLPSKFFSNTGQMIFKDLGDRIAGAHPTFSNGAVYADLDNDGDLDLVVNNIDEPALIYQNKNNDKKDQAFVDLVLKGPEKNANALGAKVILFANGGIRTYEKYPTRGFMSSMEIPIHIGLNATVVDSLFLVWPDNTFQRITLQKGETRLQLNYRKGLPPFDYSLLYAFAGTDARPMKDITGETGLAHRHEENEFPEFSREPLIPHMLSTEGPALAIADINGDGLDDIFIGSSKWKRPAVWIQTRAGKFINTPQPSLDIDSTFEEVGACWTDVNHDGIPDLVLASGGNEFFGPSPYLAPRAFLNDGKGYLTKIDHAFDSIFVNASCVVPYDFNKDGFMDLFIGGRSVPFEYGKVPRSYLLQNDGKGKFTDVTNSHARELAEIGFVTQALWVDLDKNGDSDLLLSLEWGGILAFMNHGGTFTKKILTDKKGWWNFILPVDLDNDGNLDILAGNLGLNSRLHASDQEPVRLYYYDFDGNGKKEQLLTYYLNGREIPFANKRELEKQMPGLKKSFLYAEDFAKATLNDLFTLDKLRKADTLTANYFSNAVLLNDGHLNFKVQALPWEAQLTPYRDAVVVDADGDSLPDLLLGGNYYDNNIEMGRYDADFGTILLNKGRGAFSTTTLNGLVIRGEVRHIGKINVQGRESYVMAWNNDSTRILQFLRTPVKKTTVPRESKNRE